MATLLLLALAGCGPRPAGSYLFVWAGDSAEQASDFLGVIDADPRSARYGEIVASVATGSKGHPHHTEAEMPAGDHLLANAFHSGQTWLFDLTDPLHPRVDTSFGDLAGYSHPHSFIRTADGHVLATFQYLGPSAAPTNGGHHATEDTTEATGGLVELDQRGTVIRSGSARDTTIPTRYIYPYAVLPLPASDRAVSTTTDMNDKNLRATSEWIQLWRLSDLSLLRTLALPPGPRGTEQRFTGEPRLLADGKSVYIHTFSCGLYLLRGAEGSNPVASLVWTFEGTNCGVPVLAGHYWLQTVPDAHAVVTLDVSDPERPREVSRVVVGDDESPHWLAIDRAGTKLVMNSSGSPGNRLFLLDFDPSTGSLAIDERFRDREAAKPGVVLSGKAWPHGYRGTAVPHGTVFSRASTR